MDTEKFKELFIFGRKSKIKAGDGLKKGKFPFYTSSPTLSKWIDIEQHLSEALVFGTGGLASIHHVNQPFSTSTDCLVAFAKPNKSFNVKFVYYYLFSNIRILDQGFKGAGLKHISKPYIQNLEIPLPDVETQDKVVAILDKAKSIIEKKYQTIRMLDILKWSLFYSDFNNWQSLPQPKISDIASKKKYGLSSGPFGSNLTSKHYTNGGVIILRGKNISSGKLDLSDIKYVSEEKAIELKRSEIRPDDIVIVAVGSSGKALKIPKTLDKAIISQNFNKVTCDKTKINPLFFEYCFNSNIVQWQLNSIVVDAGRTFLSLTNIKEIKIPLPKMELQNDFEKKIIKIDDALTKIIQSKFQLENLLNSLSQNAFNGELNFNTAVDLEILMENDYQFFKDNSSTKSIQLLLERIDKNDLNEKRFFEYELYDKAKRFVFELLREGKVKQVFDERTKRVKLTV